MDFVVGAYSYQLFLLYTRNKKILYYSVKPVSLEFHQKSLKTGFFT